MDNVQKHNMCDNTVLRRIVLPSGNVDNYKPSQSPEDFYRKYNNPFSLRACLFSHIISHRMILQRCLNLT
jgi:hypothetical protein